MRRAHVKTVVLALALVLALPTAIDAAAGKRPVEFKEKNLVAVPAVATITLPERFVTSTAAIGFVKAGVQGLQAGEYTARFRAGGGVFYFGPDRAYFGGTQDARIYLRGGGFWLPDDGGDPRLFYVVDDRNNIAYADSLESMSTPKQTKMPDMGWLGNVANDVEIGRLVLMPPLEDAAAAARLKAATRLASATSNRGTQQ